MAKRPSLHLLPDVLARLLKAHGMAIHMLEFRLQQHWPEIVGDHIARHTWPESIRHRKLHLVAENSVWLQQLLFLKPELLAKINGASDGEALTDMVFRVGTVPSPLVDAVPSSQPAPAKEHEERVTGGLRAAVESAVQAIPDPDLRERLRTLFSKSAS
jgi:predicted nucleic acid-binding Zn ribbon protein